MTSMYGQSSDDSRLSHGKMQFVIPLRLLNLVSSQFFTMIKISVRLKCGKWSQAQIPVVNPQTVILSRAKQLRQRQTSARQCKTKPWEFIMRSSLNSSLNDESICTQWVVSLQSRYLNTLEGISALRGFEHSCLLKHMSRKVNMSCSLVIYSSWYLCKAYGLYMFVFYCWILLFAVLSPANALC